MTIGPYDETDVERLDAIALALNILNFGDLPPYCMRYVLDKAGVIAPIIIDQESFRYRVADAISRWPNDEELLRVRNAMSNTHAAPLIAQLVKDACRNIKRG